jgi:hypothetical protein
MRICIHEHSLTKLSSLGFYWWLDQANELVLPRTLALGTYAREIIAGLSSALRVQPPHRFLPYPNLRYNIVHRFHPAFECVEPSHQTSHAPNEIARSEFIACMYHILPMPRTISLREVLTYCWSLGVVIMASTAQPGATPCKPSVISRTKNLFRPSSRSSKERARIRSQPVAQEREDLPATGDQDQNAAEGGNEIKKPSQSLWDRAADELGDQSKYVRT